MRRFYAPVENFRTGGVTLSSDETRHLSDVLRLGVGDEVSVFDGRGHEFRCLISVIYRKSSELSVIEETAPMSPESPLEITLAATVLNGEKFDLVVQKAVELGVITFLPLHTVRCEVKLKDAVKRLERWRRIALEATKQTGRATLMQIAAPIAFDDLVADGDFQNRILFSERGGTNFSTISASTQITALIGPKGGWDDFELDTARSNEVDVVTLGGRILRAETAAIAITAILQHRFGDLK